MHDAQPQDPGSRQAAHETAALPKPTVGVEVFQSLDVRVGRILEARSAPKARKPAYQLTIDFGPLGIRRSSAQITHYYEPDSLAGTLVVAVVNFPPRLVAGFRSEVLVLGAMESDGRVVLLRPDRPCEPGLPIG
ncbi:MAG: tRNA-binding protein [Limnochordaceae bacterium]|nr:tRNA-binding protein [Limnochordaceae bacterium]